MVLKNSCHESLKTFLKKVHSMKLYPSDMDSEIMEGKEYKMIKEMSLKPLNSEPEPELAL